MTMKGALLAGAVAGMFAAMAPQSARAAGGDKAPAADKGGGEKVHCMGINSCKGKSECSTASSGCAGQNSCKGKGWISVSAKECAAKKGTVVK